MIEIRPLQSIGEVMEGDDLPALLVDAMRAERSQSGDILVVTQKIVSKAEGRFVALSNITPGAKAHEIADTTGKDARLVELALAESVAVVRASAGVLITRHRLGHVMANAGIDASNLGPGHDDNVLLLPEDPDASAELMRQALSARFNADIGVLISDSFGRPWRNGVTNVCVGAAGLPVLHDRRGEPDRDGRIMQVTQIAYGDLIASAAGLAMGEGAEGVPAALVRGLHLSGHASPATALVRPPEQDLFR